MPEPKIAVFGDIILDKYSYGAVTRISPEAPIPVLAVKNEVYKPGGAGNTAANLATLGARVDLFGVIGEDHYKTLLLDAVGMFGIRCMMVTDRSRQTIVKQRLISASQQLLRVDYEVTHELEEAELETMKSRFDPPYDAVIVSDYAKGVVCQGLMEFLKSQQAPIFVDPKPGNLHLYEGVELVKPNVKECLEMTGQSEEVDGARILCSRLGASILLTRGGRGMVFVDRKQATPVVVETRAKDVIDVTGAGDTVMATYVFFHALGYSARDAIDMANAAAGIVVSKVGCHQVTREDLQEYLP